MNQNYMGENYDKQKEVNLGTNLYLETLTWLRVRKSCGLLQGNLLMKTGFQSRKFRGRRMWPVRTSLCSIESGAVHRVRYSHTPSCDARQENVNTFLTCASHPPNLRFVFCPKIRCNLKTTQMGGSKVSLGCGTRTRTWDLVVMSHASCRCSIPRRQNRRSAYTKVISFFRFTL